MAVQLVPISEVDFADFTTAFNRAYSDYYVPIAMSLPAFRALFDRDDIVPDASVAAIEDGKVVGTGLLGIRGQSGWIGGMGVIPSRRRRGIGRAMMKYLIAQAHARALVSIDLEVIEANRGAQALYRALGFADKRYLLVLERVPDPVTEVLPDLPIERAEVGATLALHDQFHPVANCWQRGKQSLEGMASNLRGWFLKGEAGPLSYAVGFADATTLRLLDVAAAPGEQAPRSAACLLAALHRSYPDAHASLFNIADNDPVLPAFEALGYTVSFRQIEMRLPLPAVESSHLPVSEPADTTNERTGA